ncbi:MAG: FHA domain-containing protein [Anaerolineales bacterium]|nr:FHA domain-containing protein [Anaerolineales bacterium]
MTARLVIQQGPTPNQEYQLQGQQMNIGRSADNEIVINDAEVSRRHARILHRQDMSGSQFLLEDLGSTNGTFVNGLRCNTLTPLAEGDIIELGDSIRLIFSLGVAEVVETAVDESDFDTADLPPLPLTPPVLPEQPVAQRPQSPDETSQLPIWRSRRFLIGCGCGTLLLLCLCVGGLLFLDSYQQGRLLYCGFLRPLFELILGPFGFAPVCS